MTRKTYRHGEIKRRAGAGCSTDGRYAARTEARHAKCRPGGFGFGSVVFFGAFVVLAAADGALGQNDSAGVTHAVPPGGLVDSVLFYVVAATATVSGLGVCFSKNVVRMAVWLFMVLGSVALVYFLLAANFLGAIQLIVYAAGTLILLIFGVMLTSKSPWVRFEASKVELLGAALVCAALLLALLLVFGRASWAVAEGMMPGVAVAELGRELLTTYLVPFEVAGVLLMLVMVGAAHLARQEK